MRVLVTAPLVAGALVLAGCGAGDSADDTNAATGTGATTAAAVVATTTMLGDVTGQIAECAGAASVTLMPIGVDPHDFSPSSAQVAALLEAELVVANGLGLEEGLADALASAEADGARVLQVAERVDPLPFGVEHSHDDGNGGLDPHFWHDVSRMATAAEVIGAELTEVTGEESWTGCGATVADGLRTLDDDVRRILDPIPADRRVLVTDHDAFGYFADAYDFEVAGVVIPGGATLAEPSSAELADLVQVVVDESVPAIFSNTASPTSLAEAVAAEAGTDVEVVPLYVGSLGPDGSGAETYAGMMTTNARRIAEALGSG